MECKFERDEVTVVRDALSNSATADDDDFGGDGKRISCLTAARLRSFYAENCSASLVSPTSLVFDINAFMNLIWCGFGHLKARKSLGLYLTSQL